MKKILSLSVAVACFVARPAICDQKIAARDWQGMGRFDPTMLSQTLGDHVGQLIAVQFNFRGKNTLHIKPNWYEGSVWQRDPTAKKGFSNVRVLFAKKDLATFQSITTDTTSATRLTFYGRVERDADNHFYFVHVLGRKATTDSAGNAVVSW